MVASKIKAIISTAITLILFVGIPYMAPTMIPEELLAQVEASGFNLSEVINQIMIIGAFTAALTLIGGFVDQTSVVSLLVKLAQTGTSLLFVLLLLGAGNLSSLGYVQFEVDLGEVTSSVAMDLSAFVYISVGVILLKVIQIFLEWREARIEAAPAGRIAP